MIRTLNNLGMEGKFLNIIKGIYNPSPRANIIFSDENWKLYP